MTEETRGLHFGIEKTSMADDGVTVGATVGGLVGAITAGVLSAGALAIPGLNLVVAGALISGAAGLGAGALTGGLLGGLIGWGIPENEAHLYEDAVARGSVLITVKPRDDQQGKLIDAIFKSSETVDKAAA